MAIDTVAVLDALASHASATGQFQSVIKHEPKSAPGNGLHAAIFMQNVRPARRSGLASTSMRVEFRVRIHLSMLMEPQDDIDPTVMRAADALMAAYSANFTLGGLVRQVDLLGADGPPLGGVFGYLPIDHKMFRVEDLTVPLVLNDTYEQGA